MEKTTRDRSIPSIRITKAQRPQTSLTRTPKKVRTTPGTPVPASPKRTPRTPVTESLNYVGFKMTEVKSPNHLVHNRNMIAAKPMSERASLIGQTLEQMIEQVEMDTYQYDDAQTKLRKLQKLIEAHNFAWNEVTLQVREYSDEHATVFAKLKTFYNQLFDEYPRLVRSYDMEIDHLKEIIASKEKNIEILEKQLNESEEKMKLTGNMIHGFKQQLMHIKDRKTYYKQELNTQIVDNENLREDVTSMRCQLAKKEEEFKHYISNSNVFDVTKAAEIRNTVSIGVDTHDLIVPVATSAVQAAPVARSAPRCIDLTSTKSEDAFNLEVIEEEPIGCDHIPVRRLVYTLMKAPPESSEPVMKVDTQAELKKFHWVYPKVMATYMSGLLFEDHTRPCTLFEQVVLGYMSHLYHTAHLSSAMAQSLIQSAQILEKLDPAMSLFGMFYRGEYDIYQFRFFHTLFEYSLGDVTPSVVDLMKNDQLTPSDTIISISAKRSREIYDAIFPFGEVPEELNGLGDLNFWDFVHIFIRKFDAARKHLWSVIKGGVCLSDCPDSDHIMYQNFILFSGLVFPNSTPAQAKQYWKDLTTRNKATEKRSDMLDFEALVFFITEKEELFFEVMKTQIAKNFMSLYYDMNASMHECIGFIVKRLIFYVPEIRKSVVSGNNLLAVSIRSMRSALFMCSISEAFAHYQMMLHLIDGIFVRDFTRIKISNTRSSAEMKQFLDHFRERERVVGIIVQ